VGIIKDFESKFRFLSIHVMPFIRPELSESKPEFGDAINIADGTVQIALLSVSNANSTLRIVKERQPIMRSDSQTTALGSFASPPMLMVEVNGIEPMTPCLQSRCSPS
jgi:hypothetical protein